MAPPGIEFSNVQFAVSPDGTHVAFVGIGGDVGRALWVANLRESGTGTTRRLTATDGASDPFWSPDSRSVGFFAQGDLKWIRLDGAEPFTVTELPTGVGRDPTGWSGTWNSDGVILCASPGADGGLFRVDARGGEPVRVTTVNPTSGEAEHAHPRFLPDGEHYLYLVYGDANVLAVGRLGNSDRETLFFTDYAVEWAASGHLLALSQGALVAHPFDLDSRRLTGKPIGLGVTPRFNEGSGKAAFSVSENGVLVVRAGGSVRESDSPLMLLGPDTSPEPFTRTVERLEDARVSPDGTRVVAQTGESSTGTLAVFFLSGRPHLPLAVTGTSPVWLDDDRIAFSDEVSGEIMVIAVDGSVVEPRPLLDTPIAGLPLSVSPDGQLLVEREGEDTGSDLWLVTLDGSAEPQPWLETRYRESGGRFSPDGRSIAYVSNRAGRNDIWTGPYGRPGATQRVIVGARSPVWSATGRELYGEGTLRPVRVELDSAGQPDGDAVELPWLDGMVLFDAGPRGRFVGGAAARASQEAGLTDLRVAVNWFEALKRVATSD